MLGLLFLLLVTVPIIEIALFIEVGGRIGLGPTLGVVILTALVGAALLRRQGLATLKSARASLVQNRLPIEEVFDGLCLAIAGALLLTPGFFTDAVGLALFVPPLRAAIRRRVGRYVAARADVEIRAAEASSEWHSGPVIDGEYRDVTPDRTPSDADAQRKRRETGDGGRDDLPKPPPRRDG